MNPSKALILLISMGFATDAIAAADYVPGLTCHEVGGFAESVAVQKSLGDTMKEQITGMRQSIPDYPLTRTVLEEIIRSIYASPALRSASPDDVGRSYEQACMAVTG